MKIRAIVFLLEWILANLLVFQGVLDDDTHTYSFYPVPWIVWNVTFAIFLFKLFSAPNDDDEHGRVWPIGPTVGAFGFVLTAIKVNGGTAAAAATPSWISVTLGCTMVFFGFFLVGYSSDVLGNEWRDAPPPDSTSSTINSNGDGVGNGGIDEKSKLMESDHSNNKTPASTSTTTTTNLVTNGPYGIIRHPIYCGLLLEALGSNVIGEFRSWIALVAFVAVATAYSIQLQQEEHELNKLLDGKYDSDYKEKTRYKLVPFVF